MAGKDFLSVTFYKYTCINDLGGEREHYKGAMLDCGVKGKIILSGEGINGAVSGVKDDVERFMRAIRNMRGMHDLQFRVTQANDYGFKRTLVKIRPEIVPLGVPGITHLSGGGGRSLKPSELKEWYDKEEDFVIVDARNDYEHEAGRFKGSLNPGIKRFRDFQKAIPLLEEHKDKKVVLFCTGGIRCEKASAYLKSKGFRDVYKLDGGIIDFLRLHGDSGYFEGSCFVFDSRKNIWVGSCTLD